MKTDSYNFDRDSLLLFLKCYTQFASGFVKQWIELGNHPDSLTFKVADEMRERFLQEYFTEGAEIEGN